MEVSTFCCISIILTSAASLRFGPDQLAPRQDRSSCSCSSLFLESKFEENSQEARALTSKRVEISRTNKSVS